MDKVLSMHMQCNAMHQLLCYCQKLTLEKRREGKGIEAFLYFLSSFTKRHLLYCIYSIKVYLFFIRIYGGKRNKCHSDKNGFLHEILIHSHSEFLISESAL